MDHNVRTKVNQFSLFLECISTNVFTFGVFQAFNLNIVKEINRKKKRLMMIIQKRFKCSDQHPSLDHFQIFTCGGAIMHSIQNKVIWSGSPKMWTNMSQQLFAAKNSRSYRGNGDSVLDLADTQEHVKREGNGTREAWGKKKSFFIQFLQWKSRHLKPSCSANVTLSLYVLMSLTTKYYHRYILAIM